MTPLGRAGRNDECAGFVFSLNQFKRPLPEPRNGVGFLGIQHKQICSGVHARHKRMGSNLSSKRGIPPPGNASAARWAATLRSEPVSRDEIPVAFDEKILAVWATRVLQIADHAWQVPNIDVTQARPLANLCCPYQRLGTGVLWVGHFVVFVKGSYVPRNIRRQASQKLGQPSQLIVRVVEPWNH